MSVGELTRVTVWEGVSSPDKVLSEANVGLYVHNCNPPDLTETGVMRALLLDIKP